MFAYVQDVPINEDIYAEIKDGLGPEYPKGLIMHVVLKTDTGLRYIDVWDSKDDLDRFTEERLHPVVGPVLQRNQVRVSGEPPRVPFEVVEVWDRSSSPSS